MNQNSNNVCVLTGPSATNASSIPISNLLEVLCPFFGNIYAIVSDKAKIQSKKYDEKIIFSSINQNFSTNIITRIINYLFAQMEISYKLFKFENFVNFYIFFIGAELLIIPLIVAKILRKYVIIALPGSAPMAVKAQKDPFSKIIAAMGTITYTLSNKIIIYSPNLIEAWSLERYKHKISIAREHFLDFDKFKTKTVFRERGNSIGYIGRLSEEKGILNFVKAMPEILKQKNNKIHFLVGGYGQLRDDIESYFRDEKIEDNVKLTGWIPHDELPGYLNQLKLLVLPSYTEGLPNVILEAMACGTPVLATSVGAIPDFIKDAETGFLMENNSPECIAYNVIRVLEHPDLEGVTERARALVEHEFTFERAMERWREVLEEVFEEDHKWSLEDIS